MMLLTFFLRDSNLKSELGGLLGNPKGTKSFSSWSEFTDFVNGMPKEQFNLSFPISMLLLEKDSMVMSFKDWL